MIELFDRVYNCAHRGASGHAPENTLAALELAVRLGADMAEIDVQQTADGQLINYEFFPLLTQSEDLTAYRISGKRAVLENRGHAALVELRPTTVDPDCGVQFSPGEQAYRVEILPGQPEAGALGGVLNSVDLVIDNVQNPRIRLLGRKDLYDIRCVQFVHGGCGQYEFTFIGTQCAIAANLYESGQRLFGHAERIDPDRSYLLPPIQFGGDIRLTILE